MEYHMLGRTGLRISTLGFGASPLGAEFGSIDPAEGRRAVQTALDLGVTYFDVAPYYGRTLAEERLGRFLEGRREQVVLATKVGRYDRDYPDGFDFSKERVIRSAEESLRRLRTDHVDVLQVHDVEFADPMRILQETLPALERLVEQGKARFVGLTGYPLSVLIDLTTRSDVDMVLSYCHYDLLDTTMDAGLTPLARDREIGLVNASPLHMGVLTHGSPPPWHPAPPHVKERARAAAEWCSAHGVDLAHLAMQFALAHPYVSTTIVGMSSEREVRRNAAAVGTVPDPDVLAHVLEILAPVKDVHWRSGVAEDDDRGAVDHSPARPA